MSHTLKSISASTVTLADVEADGVVVEIEQKFIQICDAEILLSL
jgi:hypothetical protein